MIIAGACIKWNYNPLNCLIFQPIHLCTLFKFIAPYNHINFSAYTSRRVRRSTANVQLIPRLMRNNRLENFPGTYLQGPKLIWMHPVVQSFATVVIGPFSYVQAWSCKISIACFQAPWWFTANNQLLNPAPTRLHPYYTVLSDLLPVIYERTVASACRPHSGTYCTVPLPNETYPG